LNAHPPLSLEIIVNQLDQFQVIGHISPISVGNGVTASISEVIDSAGFHGGRLVVILQIGVTTRTTGTCIMEESDDGSTWSEFMNATGRDVDGNIGTKPDADSDESDVVFDVPLDPDRKRYFRLTYTAGTEGGKLTTMISCSAILLGRRVGQEVTTSNTTKRPNSKLYSSKGKS